MIPLWVTGTAILATAAAVTAWCVREYRREQTLRAALLTTPGLYLEVDLDDAYAAIAANAARHLDLELWLETGGQA